MAFKDGDFLEVEYSVWDTATNTIIATTDEKKARAANIFEEKMKYGPVLIVIGAQGVIKGLDRELRNMKEKEEKKFTFKPADALGERSDDLVRVMSLSEFRSRDINPHPGMQVNLDNVTAIVKSVTSGRVVVDANHPYAGKEIMYEVRVLRQLTTDKDKVEALGKSYGITASQVNAAQDKVELSFNNDVSKNADYFVGKASLVASLFAHMKNVKEVDVREQYLRPAEAK